MRRPPAIFEFGDPVLQRMNLQLQGVKRGGMSALTGLVRRSPFVELRQETRFDALNLATDLRDLATDLRDLATDLCDLATDLSDLALKLPDYATDLPDLVPDLADQPLNPFFVNLG
ncbi:MAG: hypothetical protein FJW40_04225 [Acidobacteria bacterium]|nr:hypothetical protein [Acidobacteriota bacterium]